MKNTIKKKPLHTSHLVTAIFLGISAIAPGGFVGFLWWANTINLEKTWLGVVVLVMFNVLMWLTLFSLFVVALTVRNHLQSYKNLRSLTVAVPSQDATPPMPPRDFFAAHREELTAINELVLTDSQAQRPLEQFSYMWNSSSRELDTYASIDWPVTLTEEQIHMLELLRGSHRYLHIILTQSSITYNLGSYSFVYVLQCSESQEHLEHLDGKWYFFQQHKTTERQKGTSI